METRANYVLIGSFTILVMAFLFGFILWAAKYSSDATWDRYQVIFNEPVTGLSEGSSVQYNGISVGTVEHLKLDPNDPRRVVAQLKLKDEAPVKVDTRAKMSQSGIAGSPFIQLTGGSPGAPRLVADKRNEIPVILTEPSALQNIADTANMLVARLDKALSEDNIARISETLENLRATTASISDQRDDIEKLISNARLASDDLRTMLAQVNGSVQKVDREVLARLPATMDKLDAAIASFEAAGHNANALVSENRAPINQFTRDGLQQLGPTLGELRMLMRDLRQITDRLDSNPAGYLLGREQPKEFTPK
ncbi:ABC transporter substrate-binding protein [Lysobacteraceae bacterium NML71-0210]|nr:ABC transporter substrate-binding protein [Xanthomonadaceae bacterium NML71-0210]PJK14232.1 ABC transporter substrate-binding protein [Xanthomonadaceae bacterium NML07-0707]